MAAKKSTSKKKTQRKTSPKRRAASASSSDFCFTIMPFGGWLDDYYNLIYCPAIEAAGLTPCRADDLYRPSTIVNDIWSYTKQAKLVLADLTGKNPNVFYELGLAHALAKPAILIAESMDDVPFDLRSLRVIEYDKNDPEWGSALGQKIQSSIGEVLESPLEAVLPAFLEVRANTRKPSVSEREKDILELKQEVESLRAEMLSRKYRSSIERERAMTKKSAVDLLHRYLDMKLPYSSIRERLLQRGVPLYWVDEQLSIMEEKPIRYEPEAETAPIKKVVAKKKKVVAKKKRVVAKKKRVVAKKKRVVAKKKRVVAKKKRVVAKKKRVVAKKKG